MQVVFGLDENTLEAVANLIEAVDGLTAAISAGQPAAITDTSVTDDSADASSADSSAAAS